NQEELAKLGEICVKHNIFIVSDELYEKLIYTNDEHVSIAQLSDKLKEQTVCSNGVSKSHAMTGWRIGYAAGSPQIIKAITNLAAQSTSNTTYIAQSAALAAYEQAETKTIEDMKKVLSESLDLFYDLLIDIPGISCVNPNGAFYLFPNFKEAVRLN